MKNIIFGNSSIQLAMASIAFFIVTATLSYPTNTMARQKWVNPCGIDPAFNRNQAIFSYHKFQVSSRSEMMQNILTTTRKALKHCEAFRETFVRSTFNTDWENHHFKWKEQRYSWLPSWQDILADMKNLKLSTALPRIYNHLQRFAVGLEEIVDDQTKHQEEFIQEFTEAEYNLKAALCEIQMAMLELNLESVEDISRDIINIEAINMQDKSYRDLRDWYVYRDYINHLENTIQILLTLKSDFHQTSTSTSSLKISNKSIIVLFIFCIS